LKSRRPCNNEGGAEEKSVGFISDVSLRKRHKTTRQALKSTQTQTQTHRQTDRHAALVTRIDKRRSLLPNFDAQLSFGQKSDALAERRERDQQFERERPASLGALAHSLAKRASLALRLLSACSTQPDSASWATQRPPTRALAKARATAGARRELKPTAFADNAHRLWSCIFPAGSRRDTFFLRASISSASKRRCFLLSASTATMLTRRCRDAATHLRHEHVLPWRRRSARQLEDAFCWRFRVHRISCKSERSR
jgi:hypothetical protein